MEQQPNPDPAELAEVLEEESPEEARLLMHRASELIRLGFSLEQIEELPLRRADIAHTAEALLNRGAPHVFVVLELKED